MKQALVLLFCPLVSAAAQRSSSSAAEDTVPRSHIFPALGLHVGAPQKASAAVGVVLGEDWQKDGRDHSRHVALFVEPGLDAGRASVAFVRHGYGSFGSGFAVAGTVLRTWKEPWVFRDNATYAGGEVLLWPVLFVGPRVGLFRSIAGNPTDRRWFGSIDFGIGF
ncbi:MAG: hypothetical protein ABI085_11165 [Gemmatimonadaceae bacterium]